MTRYGPRCEECGRYLKAAFPIATEWTGLTQIVGICNKHGEVSAMRGLDEQCWDWDYWFSEPRQATL